MIIVLPFYFQNNTSGIGAGVSKLNLAGDDHTRSIGAVTRHMATENKRIAAAYINIGIPVQEPPKLS